MSLFCGEPDLFGLKTALLSVLLAILLLGAAFAEEVGAGADLPQELLSPFVLGMMAERDGDTYGAFSGYDSANYIAGLLLKSGRLSSDSLIVRQIHLKLATRLRLLGRFEEAMDHTKIADELVRKAGDNSNLSLAHVLNERALILSEMGRNEQAVSLFEEALKYARDHKGGPSLEATVQINLGAHFLPKDTKTAERNFDEALRKLKKADMETSQEAVSALIGLARVQLLQNNMLKAFQSLEEAMNLSMKLKSPEYISDKGEWSWATLNQRVVAYLLMARLSKGHDDSHLEYFWNLRALAAMMLKPRGFLPEIRDLSALLCESKAEENLPHRKLLFSNLALWAIPQYRSRLACISAKAAPDPMSEEDRKFHLRRAAEMMLSLAMWLL